MRYNGMRTGFPVCIDDGGKRMRRSFPKRTLVFAMLTVAWLVALFELSTQSGTDSGALSKGLTQKMLGWLIAMGVNENTLEHIVRKFAHFSGFALSGFFAGMTFFSVWKRRTAWIVSVGFEAAMAILNELSQLIPTGRACSVKDMLIDLSGAVLGIAIAHWIDHHLGHTERQGMEL